jgi:Dolichyl-phosphate-mannose-protein mannosyltransferase
VNAGHVARESADSPWFQRTADAANRGSPLDVTSDFTESQQAGLAAAIALAQADAAAVSRSAPRARPPSQPAASVRAPAVSTAPARHAAVEDLAGTAVDLPSFTADREVGISDDWAPAAAVGQHGAVLASGWLAYVQTPLLMVILTTQAVLSLRLIWSNTAFLDEATYLLAGHAEIAHWLHGTPVRAYATFSGSPDIYPPIAALAARLGGLAAARILSLLCVVGTTFLLWSTTRKLFGASAALCAATLFAIIGPTVQLGAFATLDVMALLLLAASAWCVVSARERTDSTFLLIAGTVLLVLANATEYATVIFDPSVVAIAGLAIATKRGAKPAIARSGYVAAGVLALTGALLALARPAYSADVLSAIVHEHWASAALTVLAGAWKWTGLLFVIAAAGVILCVVRRDHRVQLMILTVLAATSALALVTQPGLQTKISLSEHVDFAAWFAAAGAGYAISRLSRIGRRRLLRLALAGLILIGIAVPGAIAGRAQAWTTFHEWPNTVRVIADLRSVTREHPGQYLAEDYDVPAYYLESTTSWQQWSGTWYFSYTPPGATRRLTGLTAYRAAIDHHYFSVVILDFEATSQTDYALQEDMTETGNYQVIKVVRSSVAQYTIWAYKPVGSR